MGTWRVALSPEAEADLERVTVFLARKSPLAAERIGLELVEVIFSLDTLPARGSPMRGRPGLRKVVHRHYLVIYRLHETARLVEVVRVWDGRLDPAEFRFS
ncbi:MAG: type II toxin-antitoxin system RelE/ParE family toxin [Verrucomicrobia bacterium]|nr:type II toxin-antitoxin system RelE/ParE family toxin [Verrucomicrobiota bacterium]